MKPPEVVPEPDWREFELPFDIGSGRSMFVETEDGPTIRMGFYEDRTSGALVGRVWFAPATFGPPGFVHGGLIAYVMDEAMGTAAWLAGYPCVAASISVDYVEMTPLGEDCSVESRVLSVESKKLVVEGRLDLDGRTLVKARGIFVRVKKDRLGQVGQGKSLDGPDLSRFKFA